MKNKNIKVVITSLFSLLLSITILAQNPLPGAGQSEIITITNATVHVGNGKVIENGQVTFEKGKIAYVGTSSTAITGKIIDAQKGHVYPGLISMANVLGLVEIESIPAVRDNYEMGELNPNVRALVAYNTDSDVIPTVRANGVLVTQATPEGGLIAGQSAVFQLDGWNWQDAVLKADDGIWINYPSRIQRKYNDDTDRYELSKNESRDNNIQTLLTALAESKNYDKASNTPNLKLEAMKGLFDGSKTAYVITSDAKDIMEAVTSLKAMGIIKIAIVGGENALDCADFMVKNQIPVLVYNTHDVPSQVDSPVYENYELPAKLTKAGIKTVITYGSLGWRTRNLPFLAGTAIAFGMDKEEALKAITINAAEVMGLDKQIGTLEIGKHATIVIAKGDIFDMKSNTITHAFIQGKVVDLDDKQKKLYQKFSKNIKNNGK